MTASDDAPRLAGLDIFLPSPPPDVERQEAFLDEAAALALDGQPITVYLQDEDAWAFEECEPVRALMESAGDAVAPVTLLGLDIVVSGTYPTTSQMQRFAQAGAAKKPKPSAGAARLRARRRRAARRARPAGSPRGSWAPSPRRRGRRAGPTSAHAATSWAATPGMVCPGADGSGVRRALGVATSRGHVRSGGLGPSARRPVGPSARRPVGPSARRPVGPSARRPVGPSAQSEQATPLKPWLQ
ncbi:hypothetical protein [Brachybacterium sp. GPGPB12]|uniref:hypothetical protein n=1 Tax=Brachybacterium sp. GPGPB12 TaxID=3023517 RepID=UPI0031345FA9